MENQNSSCDRSKSPVQRGRVSTCFAIVARLTLSWSLHTPETADEKMGQDPRGSDLGSLEPSNGPEHQAWGPQEELSGLWETLSLLPHNPALNCL